MIPLLMLSMLAFGQEVEISYGKNNELILTSSSCDHLVSNAQSLCQWKKQLEPDFSLPTISQAQCRKLSNGKFSLTNNSCLPQFAKNYHHKKLVNSGANCWGTAMSFKNISTKPRYIWPEEMEYWMNSPVCRKLDVGESLKEGDIINVYGPEYIFEEASLNDKGLKFWNALFPNRYSPTQAGQTGYSGFHNFLHSETYIGKDLTFGKDSPSHEDRFDFHHLAEVYGRSRESECQENQALDPYRREYQNPPRPIKGSPCDYFTIAYRCGNIDEHLKDGNSGLLDEIKELRKYQERLFPLMLTNKGLTKTEVNAILQIADSQSKNALEELKTPTDKTTEMLLTLKYFSAQSLRKSLEQARLTPATEPL